MGLKGDTVLSRRLKKKAIILIAAELIFLAVLGTFLITMQTNLSVSNQKKDISEKLSQMDELITQAEEASVQNQLTYDAIYQAKADSVAYMAEHEVNFQISDSCMKEYQELLKVDNLLVVNKDGTILAQAAETPADFSYARYNQLRTVFTTKKSSEAFEVNVNGIVRRYYGSALDDSAMVVIEEEPTELYELKADTSTWSSILNHVSVGLNGYTFVISAKNYLIEYHPDEKLIGTDSLDGGIPVEALEDGNYTWLTLNGEKLYCGITKINDNYLICAIPESEIASSRAITVGIILFIFFAVMTIAVCYGLLLMHEEEQSEPEDVDYHIFGIFRYNKKIGRKAFSIFTIGLIVIFAVSLYMQTLFSLSRQSMNNSQRIQEVESAMADNSISIESLTRQYNERYLNKCEIAAYIIQNKPELADKASLRELRDTLQIKDINVFNTEGTITATSASYTHFTLSNDPESQSYEFHKLLNGGDHLIQAAQRDETLGEYQQFIGKSLYNDEESINGFVQIAIRPSRLEKILAGTDIGSVLNGIRVGANGFAFSVNKEDSAFSYYPEKKMINRSAVENGIKKEQLHNGYSGYLTIGNVKYFVSSMETDADYIYVAVPSNELSNGLIPLTLTSTAFALICLAILFFLLTCSKTPAANEEPDSEKPTDGLMDVVMPDGRVSKTLSAANRWSNITPAWDEKTPEQQVASIVGGLFSLFALAICIAVLFRDKLLESNSIFAYIISGKWERGINIFSVTGCIMIICVAAVITMILKRILKVMSKTFSARGETICRLLKSFVKYISILVMLYYCFALFGVDTKTLLASAGILSLVVGLGAKDLVTDVLAGLFLIFEGEFRVGDIVMIDGYRGTVVEIGIRTTKIEDPGKNIKIFNNSSISGIINMTKKYSVAACTIGIEYGESLERVESILEKEFPNLRKRLPSIKEGPFYLGVSSLGDNSVDLKITAQCLEADRAGLERSLNREMKLLFDKYNINIPFPQIVLNEPVEYIQATASEKAQADRFYDEQKAQAKQRGLAGEDDEEER